VMGFTGRRSRATKRRDQAAVLPEFRIALTRPSRFRSLDHDIILVWWTNSDAARAQLHEKKVEAVFTDALPITSPSTASIP